MSAITKLLNKYFNTEAKKVVLNNFFSLSLLQVANYLLPLITLPYLVRVLGIDKFGLLAFATSFVFYFRIIVDYGFKLTATRDISKYREDKSKVQEIYSAVMIIRIWFFLISIIGLFVSLFFIERFSSEKLVFIFTFGIVLGETIFPVWFFQGMEKMKYITYLNILSKLIFTIAIFFFIRDESDYIIVPLLTSFGYIVAGIISLIIIRVHFEIKFKLQPLKVSKKYLVEGWNVFIVDFMPNLYNNFSTFYLGLFASMTVVGYFSLAKRLVDIANSFIYVIRNATYPFLVRNFQNFRSVARITLLTGTLFFIGIVVFSLTLLEPVFGAEAIESKLYINILSISPFFMAIAVTYGSNKLIILKRDKLMRNITLVYSLIGFIVALIFIPWYQGLAAALTLVISRFIMAALTYYYAQLKIEKNSSVNKFLYI